MPQYKPIPIPGSASDWLARAKGDLALARGPLPEGAFLQDLCFHAQQAAEKAIKALYVHQGLVFRYTHDLDDLLTVYIPLDRARTQHALVEAESAGAVMEPGASPWQRNTRLKILAERVFKRIAPGPGQRHCTGGRSRATDIGRT